jgi:ParB-like chromosome segregation protein Spo0J
MNVVTNLALAGDLAGTAATPANAEQAGAERDEQITLVPISSLRAADSPRLTGESDEHVRVLVESDAALPPITVHRGTMRVIDGMHRLSAARLRGQTEIEVRFAGGDDDDVFVLAVQANVRHGLPLTLSDRKAAAERILASHPQWSDRKIASVTALSPSTVGSMRRRSTNQDGHSNTRLGQDGTDRPLSTAAGRALARDLLAERPNASVREIATIAGIAPSTVHDVQRRLREGQEPVPPASGSAANEVRGRA